MNRMVHQKKQKKMRSPATCELLEDEQVALLKSRCEQLVKGKLLKPFTKKSEHLPKWKNRKIPVIVLPMAREKQMQAEPHTQSKE